MYTQLIVRSPFFGVFGWRHACNIKAIGKVGLYRYTTIYIYRYTIIALTYFCTHYITFINMCLYKYSGNVRPAVSAVSDTHEEKELIDILESLRFTDTIECSGDGCNLSPSSSSLSTSASLPAPAPWVVVVTVGLEWRRSRGGVSGEVGSDGSIKVLIGLTALGFSGSVRVCIAD